MAYFICNEFVVFKCSLSQYLFLCPIKKADLVRKNHLLIPLSPQHKQKPVTQKLINLPIPNKTISTPNEQANMMIPRV